MKKRAKLKNSAEPLLVRRYLRSSLLSPSKNWFKNFYHRRTVVDKETNETILLISSLFFGAALPGILVPIFTGAGLLATFSSPLYIFLLIVAILSGLFLLISLLGRMGVFKDDERVELDLPEHLSKHLDKVPEQLIHEFYSSTMDFRMLKKVLYEIDETLSKGMSRFFRRDLLKKQEEVLQEAEKVREDTEMAFSKIKSIVDEFAEIDKIHKEQEKKKKKQAKIREHNKEALDMLALLNSKTEDDIHYVDGSKDIKQRFVR